MGVGVSEVGWGGVLFGDGSIQNHLLQEQYSICTSHPGENYQKDH